MSKDESRRGQGLAARLRAGLDQRERAAADEREAARLAQARASKEREAVLEDLAAFGRALGHISVRQRKDSLELRRGEAALRFEPVGDAAQIRVTGDGLRGDHLLDWEPRLDRWVLVRRHRMGREQRELLFDAGLARLMSLSFGLQVADMAEPVPVEVEQGGTEEPSASADTEGFGSKRTL